MPASKTKMAAKATLLAPVGPIMAWGVEQLLSGAPATGATALVIGTLLTVGFVAVNEYDIPYEDEILSIIQQNTSQEQVEEAAKDASEYVGEQVNEATETGEGDA